MFQTCEKKKLSTDLLIFSSTRDTSIRLSKTESSKQKQQISKSKYRTMSNTYQKDRMLIKLF